MTEGGAIPSASPTATNVAGSVEARSEWPVYKVTTTDGLGRSEPPNRAVPWEPIAATIRAPAELPHSEYPAVVTPREPAFRKTWEIAAARSSVASVPPRPARYFRTKALYPRLLISAA
jgi:hypothetical protein